MRAESEYILIGYTNGDQIFYASEADGQGSFYPDSENNCYIPVYMLKTHWHRIRSTSFQSGENDRFEEFADNIERIAIEQHPSNKN